MVLSRAALFTAWAVWALCGPLQLSAQLRMPQHWQWEAGVSAHVSGYSGDIGNKGDLGALTDTQWGCVQSGLGVHFRGQQRGKRVGWNLDLRRIHIEGADSLSNNLVAIGRNLHFRNRMTELAATADVAVLRFSRSAGMVSLSHQLKLQGGLALLHHTPEAQLDRDNLLFDDLNTSGFNTPGEWHDLRAIQTEGVDYAKTVVTAPMGFAWTCSFDRGMGTPWHVTVSALWRLTRTDRLDDIHSRYVDNLSVSALAFGLSSQANPDDLPTEEGTPSLTNYQYMPGVEAERQAVRGNAATRDQYWTFGVTVAKSLSKTPVQAFHRQRFRGPRVENKR